MASEEPPSIRRTPLPTITRLISAPPVVDALATAPVVKMDSANKGVSAPQADAQTAGSGHTANEDLPAATGHDENPEVAAPSTVKVEPDSGASVRQNVPSNPPDGTSAAHGDSPLEKKDATATHKQPDAITLDNIQKLVHETDLTKLEAGVNEALAILDTLQAPLSDSKQTKQREWLSNIKDLRQQLKNNRTVVAVVGETGAGKTSLINAVLDEDKLLVTSGWRACTAVICEISYNETDDPQKAYRAEVEFISKEAWDHDLVHIFGDLLEDDHLSSATFDSKTEAGISLAKSKPFLRTNLSSVAGLTSLLVKAVYPDLTDSTIKQHTAESLARRERVAEVLGTTRRIDCSSASELCSAVQKYMDSKEKSTKLGQKEAQMAFWPLIKVIRIFCRAEVLSTGLVIVDLPGVADSNPARSAIATKYMTECSAVWVAAPIKRATDNKVAKELMGKSSRLQMKLDGILSNVTFICTMTDAIDFTEALEAFDYDGQIQATYSREDQAQKMIEEKGDALRRLTAQMRDADFSLNSLDEELQVWQDIRKKHQKGHEVFPPHVPSKRKRPTGSRRPRTACRKVVDGGLGEEEVPEVLPLTEHDISTKLDHLHNEISPAENDYAEMERQQEVLEQELVNLEQEKNDAAIDGARLCIQRRNKIVKNSIRDDFASGIRELDEDEPEGEEGTFDPTTAQSRDYRQVAQSLPVFTISAKAYQRMCRPKKRETQIDGFKILFDTEIPQLVEHAMKLPEKGRIIALRNWLNEVRRLLVSLIIWCTAGDVNLGAIHMSAHEQTWEMQFLQNEILNLRKKLDRIIMAQKKEIDDIVQKEVESKSSAAIKSATNVIGSLVGKWSVKEEQGGRGIQANTYRATCRRNGKRTKAQKSFDFNEAILEPYLQKIANGWEQAFSRSIPWTLDNFAATLIDALKEFHGVMSSRRELEKCRTLCVRILSQQLDVHSKSIEATIQSMKDDIQSEQRQANKAFTPEIQAEMLEVYRLCRQEKGPGCFQRIKDIMQRNVAKNKNAIYRRASKRVLKEVNKIFESNGKEMMDSVATIVERLQKDFEMLLSNSTMIEASEVARDHIRDVLQGVDTRFGSILSGEPMEVDSAQPPACEPQQLPNGGMTDVEPASGGATEAAPSGEDVALDTAL
ncbi:hypothetical protein KVR01_013485 [Diaporthe batatas]|uniref:uncharacterized protein n=1 Tax=Diaporthe batatas TaxID=748121 RepID=UPI001D049BF2|nr:uncharacterized protein KVR01_013485 [Diaporthe batatas]KAG8156694.1 hypothetical protein KVR01_013485 [Diaporthe batatas]